MASSSVLPTINQLSERISHLLRRNSRTEAETRSVTLQCLALKSQIEQIKASVVEERMKQQVCADQIARLKEMAAPRRPNTYSMIATPGTPTPRPRSKCVSHMATARRGQENDSCSTSLRTKRNGMFFDEETSRRMSACLESSLRQRIQ